MSLCVCRVRAAGGARQRGDARRGGAAALGAPRGLAVARGAAARARARLRRRARAPRLAHDNSLLLPGERRFNTIAAAAADALPVTNFKQMKTSTAACSASSDSHLWQFVVTWPW